MDNLRDPDALRALKDIQSRIDDVETDVLIAKQEYQSLQEDLSLLREERERISTPELPSRLLTASYLEAIEKAVEELDKPISEQTSILKLAKKNVKQEEDTLGQLYQARRSLLSQVSPAQVLPEELWLNIWTWVDTMAFHSDREAAIAFLLSRVCSRWREILVRTPRMWRRIRVHYQSSLDRLRVQLWRSTPYMLDITYVPDFPFINVPAAQSASINLSKLLAELAWHSERWRSLHIGENPRYHRYVYYSDATCLAPRIFRTLLSDVLVPNLQHLCVWWTECEIGSPVNLFRNGAPSLTAVQLLSVDVPENMALLQGLTSLELIQIPPNIWPSARQLQDILVKCPALSHLGLDGLIFDQFSETHSLTPVALPSLRMLKLCFKTWWEEELEDVNYPEKLFHLFNAPQLSTLQLIDFDTLSSEQLVGVLEATPLACGNQSLEVLYLHSGEDGDPIEIDPSVVARLLKALPNLRHLWLDADKGDVRKFMDVLVSGGPHVFPWKPLCPALQTLTLEVLGAQLEDDRGGYVRNFLDRRRRQQLSIKTVRLYPQDQAYVAPSLLAWCHENLTLELLSERGASLMAKLVSW